MHFWSWQQIKLFWQKYLQSRQLMMIVSRSDLVIEFWLTLLNLNVFHFNSLYLTYYCHSYVLYFYVLFTETSNRIYIVFLLCLLSIFHAKLFTLLSKCLFWYYKKNRWVSDHSVEIMWIGFAYGYFTSLQDEWNIPTQKQFTWSRYMITTNLFLFLCHTIIDFVLILIVNIYNFKEFTSETAISLVGVVIHNKRGS